MPELFLQIARFSCSTRQLRKSASCVIHLTIVLPLMISFANHIYQHILQSPLISSSALDAESEHLVQQAIDKAVVGRTVIVVAHRLSTIRQADQIVVMDKHKIVDVGQHDALLDKSSKYQDLIKRQSVMIRDVSSSGLKNLESPH